MIGTVTVWHESGHYGYVAIPGVANVAFLHKNDVLNGVPQVGDRVEVGNVERTSRGMRCTGWIAIMNGEQETINGNEL